MILTNSLGWIKGWDPSCAEPLRRFSTSSDERKRLGNLKEVKYSNIEDSEISLSGLGFISFFGHGTIVVHTFENINTSIRKQLIWWIMNII